MLLLPATSSFEEPLPVVAITSLSDGDWVEGVIEITVAAEGEVAFVELLINDEVVTTAVCTDCIAWDTRIADTTAPAEFTLVARATYNDGSQMESEPMSVTVLYPRQLTFDGAADLQPEWSPAGDRLVFKSNRGLEEHIYHLYTLAVVSGDLQPVVTDRSYHGYPGWSPGGERMVFNSYAPEEGETTSDMDIYAVNLSSGESVQVTFNPAFDDSGRWSPDGKAISFHSSRDGSLDVWKVAVAPDGTPQGEPQRLTTGNGSEHCPRWSFDGEWITYEAERGETNDIWVMRSDGSDARQVTNDTHYDRYPGWSPDGKWLIYDSERDGNRDLYLVPVEGGTPRRVTMDGALDRHADWSPEDNLLAFHSSRSDNFDIWLVEIPDPGKAMAARDTETGVATGELLLPLVLGATAVAVALFLRRRSP